MDEPIGFIATGLGGKGQKIRYYFVLFSKEPLREVMIDEIAANYREVAKRYDAEIESVEQIGNQISIGLLCPMKNVAWSEPLPSGGAPSTFTSQIHLLMTAGLGWELGISGCQSTR